MRFGVLGPLAVWAADGTPVPVREPKVRALLAALLLAEGGPVAPDRLVEALWGGLPPGDPTNTLQTKVSQLRRALGGAGSVLRRPGGYLLPLGPDELDAHEFRALVARARAAAPADRVGLLDRALGLWRGAALADLADRPFAVAAAARLDGERLAAALDRADAALATGGGAALVGELTELAAAHPTHERLHGLLMRALHRAGRQDAALDVHAALRARLVERSGLEPGAELARLQAAILAQDPALDAPAPPPPRPARLPAAPPAPLTALFGRTDDVRDVRAALAAHRLVTLTGPGGVGKTRLALAVADSLPGEVVVVELAGLDRAGPAGTGGVAEAVAAALGVHDGPADLDERLGSALRTRELVLVLDDCEQVVEPVAALVPRLLAAAPGLRVLATSREPLGTGGEVLREVRPLAVPPPGDDRPEEFAAVALFADRAAAAAPGFVLDAATAPVVAAICRRLDGLPLALELAAGRVRALGAQGVLGRLDDRFRLLSTGRRGVPERQRTLRAVIDWSWRLLTDDERAVLRRLAVHPEGCDLAAAEAVCAGPDVAPADVLDVLARLVDRSLVVSRPDGPRPRFRLLETVAAYGLDRLREAGEHDAARDRHAAHFLALAEGAAPALHGRGQGAALELLDREAANLRAAADHLCRPGGDAAAALRLAGALTWYRFLRGRLGEAERELRRALARPGPDDGARARAAAWLAALRVLDGDAPPPALVPPLTGDDVGADARARWFLGYVLTTVGDMRAATRLTDDALRAFEAVGDRWGMGAALADRSTQVLARGDADGARAAAERAAALFAEVGEGWGQVQTTFALGALAEIGGDYAGAVDQHRAGLRTAERLGLWAEVSYQLSWLGRVALLRGDLDGARELHERAERTAVEHGFAAGRVFALIGLALGARRAGELDAAERHLTEVLRWQRGLADEPGNYLILAELGFVAELRGDAAAALRHQLDALAVARRLADPRAHALAWEGLAGALVLAGDAAAAARLLGAAAAARRGVGFPLPAAERGDVDRITARASAALGAAAFAAEHARGAAADPAELLDPPVSPSSPRRSAAKSPARPRT
ncbi:BTAD domain-containing putative transcriptional regulator [Pseudonocardia humida]|uniref:Winged helix-turn-helix domain-containing protein n=1 Tax=Pseudonocardia humida TaxID=2800819 RepID=A0ABT1A9E8_9PSEU|nr:BTAD domain-containing putative transcriptional regulator [Pseudonocardia humida]MCO1659650.1 winged helix-turn-helix domain-containing protein [Pseudonocardia humida]